MAETFSDQDGKPVRGGLDDVTYCMVAGKILLGHDGKRLPDSSAPIYLSFDAGDGKVLRLLNSGYREKK